MFSVGRASTDPEGPPLHLLAPQNVSAETCDPKVACFRGNNLPPAAVAASLYRNYRTFVIRAVFLPAGVSSTLM